MDAAPRRLQISAVPFDPFPRAGQRRRLSMHHLHSVCRGLAALLFLSASGSELAAQADSAALALRTDSVFADYDRADAPGCALGVYRDGRIEYARGYGMADLEHRVPIATHTVFDLGSTSKQFTAASVLLLAQEGKLSLDDDVRRHVPELPAYGTPITIRHLLNHTSGLRDYIGVLSMGGMRYDDVTTPQDALDAIVRQRQLNFEPGTKHLYSNSGYFLLSIIVERVAGKSLRDFARERIFAPLGMERTHYLGSYDDVVPDRAIGYERRADGTMRSDMPRWMQLGDGAVFSTVEELLRWDTNFYEPVVGGRALLDSLHERGVLTDGTSLEYALGLIHGRYRGLRTVSHGGSWGGYRAEMLRFPDQRFSVATLCNFASANPSELALRVADVHLAAALEPGVSPVAAERDAANGPEGSVAASVAQLRTLPGAYRDSATRAIWSLERRGDTLQLNTGMLLVLRPVGADEFEIVDGPVGQLRVESEGGRVRGLRFESTDESGRFLERLDVVAPTAAELAMYEGSYRSDELLADWRITRAGGTLRLERRGEPPMELRPLDRDAFAAGSMELRFVRASEGSATAFSLDAGRARGIVFERVADDGGRRE